MSQSCDLLIQVRIGFLQQGISFAKWCAANGVGRQWATAALTGKRNGPAAQELRTRIIMASITKEAA